MKVTCFLPNNRFIAFYSGVDFVGGCLVWLAGLDTEEEKLFMFVQHVALAFHSKTEFAKMSVVWQPCQKKTPETKINLFFGEEQQLSIN